jgi:serine acetyltransferase
MDCPQCGTQTLDDEWNCQSCRMNVYWASQHYADLANMRLGDRSVIAAGSTVVSDLPEDALLIARAPAEIRTEGGIRYHRRRKERRSSRSGQSSPEKKGQD